MYVIREQDSPVEKEIKCSSCERTFEVRHWWIVDAKRVCDDCFELNYSELEQCEGSDEYGVACPHYSAVGNFTDGLCDQCWELSEPPDQDP